MSKVSGKQTVVKEVSEEIEFDVTKYVALEPVFLSTGVIVLKGYAQLAKQARRCVCLNEKAGVYRIEYKLCFKKGEVFEFDGVMIRLMAMKVSTDEKEIKVAEKVRDAKDKAWDDKMAEGDKQSKIVEDNRVEL